MPRFKDNLSKVCRVIGARALIAAVPFLLWLGTQDLRRFLPAPGLDKRVVGRELERGVSYIVESVQEQLPDYVARYDSTSDSYIFTSKDDADHVTVAADKLDEYLAKGTFRDRTVGLLLPKDSKAGAMNHPNDRATPLRAALESSGANFIPLEATEGSPRN